MSIDFTKVSERLQRRRSELLVRHDLVEHDMARSTGPLSADFEEQAVEVENDEVLEAIGRSASEEVVQIDEALARLARGEYGICTCCGKAIAPGRLNVMPQATTCAGCRL